jgi:hypothetical protein
MDRSQLVQTLRDLKCPFEVDFSDEFLQSISIERLRHILMAATLHVINADGAGEPSSVHVTPL